MTLCTPTIPFEQGVARPRKTPRTPVVSVAQIRERQECSHRNRHARRDRMRATHWQQLEKFYDARRFRLGLDLHLKCHDMQHKVTYPYS